VRLAEGLSPSILGGGFLGLSFTIPMGHLPLKLWRGGPRLTGDAAEVRQCPIRLTNVGQNVVAIGRVEECEGGAGCLPVGPTAEGCLGVIPGHTSSFFWTVSSSYDSWGGPGDGTRLALRV